MRNGLVKKAARRFIPGERVEDALSVAAPLRRRGIGIVLTQLGENVSDARQADDVAQHYAGVLDAIRARGLDADISIKLTQLGLDLGEELCYRHLRSLAERAAPDRRFIWIDMEQYGYVDRTLRLFGRIASEFPTVGVCLQAYLHRTENDLRAIDRVGLGVRLVKGAYRESPSVAVQRRQDVAARYLALAGLMLDRAAAGEGWRAVFGTHDPAMIAGVRDRAGEIGRSRDTYEFHMLYGIEPAAQTRLAAEGHRVRALISYGEQWFPWYMRRLAERPANMWLVARSMLGSE